MSTASRTASARGSRRNWSAARRCWSGRASLCCRVTQADLVAAGLDRRVDPRSWKMFVDGVEQPIRVRGEQDGRFDASDVVEFYATGLDVASTDTRVYWLVAGSGPGRRINPAVA